LIVAAGLLDDDEPVEPEPPVFELLDPHAATPAATTIAVAAAVMRRFIDFVSLI